jgi:Melibiase
VKIILAALTLALHLIPHCLAETSHDAYITTDGAKWTLGSASVEMSIALQDGMLVTTGFKNKVNGHDLLPSNATGPWMLVEARTSRLKQGELQLDLVLRRDSLVATKTYVVYPGSSIIREWTEFKNVGSIPLQITDPDFFTTSARLGDPESLDFDWMTGGNNAHGSWVLKTEKLSVEKPRRFDSDDPFPDRGVCGDFVDGKPNLVILLNDKPIWPARGEMVAKSASRVVPIEVGTEVHTGDRIAFLAKPNRAFDTLEFDPTVSYSDGETHVASKEFSSEQGGNSWHYQFSEQGKYGDLVLDESNNEWHVKQGDMLGPFVASGSQRGGVTGDSARVWTAMKPGTVKISGSICSVSLSASADAKPGFRAGSSSYAPWAALYNHATRDGLFIGWDYFGHWASSYTLDGHGSITARMHVRGYNRKLLPGETVTTPRAFVGLFEGDLDDAGNALLDWQYQYLWDYTRDDWFPGIRMLGDWWKGTAWGLPGGSWTGGGGDFESTARKVFRLSDMMRETGADVYHRDWGWWDRAGDWSGPDFRTTGEYLRKSGMGQLIYAFLYTVDPESKVAREHPDWIIKDGSGWSTTNTLDMSRPEVVAFMQAQLDGFVAQWGDFEWRNDSMITSRKNGDDTPLLGQDEGMRAVLQGFLDKHPGAAFQAVNGGGLYAGYDYVRYSSNIQFSDAAVGLVRNQWAALLLPPDKVADNPDAWRDVSNYDKATWRGWLCLNPDTVGDTWDPVKLDGLRELFGIYHYLQAQGVVGRWVHVFRPLVTGDDPTMYFQRMSRDGRRGIVIPKRVAPGPVTIYPKGLLPTETYVVNYQESHEVENRTGADLMTKGITFAKMPPGELIYLNLSMHPGSTLDKEPPKPPSAVTKHRADNMGFPGVELKWQPGSDNNWISYYEIIRDGVSLDKVAKGTFYFDHSAGADLGATYEVRTVDGGGNVSVRVAAQGLAVRRSRIVDDASHSGIEFSPQWKHSTEESLVAYNGTITSSKVKGATAELTFEGKRVLWFTKLGAENGEAALSIDGGPATIVDTYSADDIWGVGYRKEFLTAGRHRIRIEVLGKRGVHPAERSKDTLIFVDGIRVEME